MLKSAISQYLLMVLFLPLYAWAQYDPNHFDPDNAAHWYRKAFELYEEPNGFDLDEYIHYEKELMPEVERYLVSQKAVIDLITKATQIEHCNWEFDPLANGVYTPNPYLTDVKNIAILLIANSHHKEMKEQCRNIQNQFEPVLQLSSHVDSEVLINHLVSLAIRSMAYEAIREYLNRHSNLQLVDLYRAKSFINNESKHQKLSYKDTLMGDIQTTTKILTNYKAYIYTDQFWTEQLGIPVKKLSGDFYKRNLEFYRDYKLKIQSYLDLPYPQATQKIDELGKSLHEKSRNYFAKHIDILEKEANSLTGRKLLTEIDVKHIEKCDFFYTVIATTGSSTMLSIETRVQTKLNALQSGIELLIQYRTTKKIPERLPFNSPKDLFSDKPFLIIKTKNGFKLKCQRENLNDNKIHEYEFALSKDTLQ